METLYKTLHDANLGIVTKNVPLGTKTSLRVGGSAKIVFQPENESKLMRAMEFIHASGKQFKTIGRGSNLLISDDDYNGVIILLDRCLNQIKVDETTGIIEVETGFSLMKLASVVANHGLTGLEFASGIPGNVGGAIFMNAGIKDLEMKDVVLRVKVVLGSGKSKWLTNKELEFGYRKSILQEHRDWVCTKVELQLEKGDKETIVAKINHLREIRQKGQPLSLPNCGSVFRNPLPDYAGKLIEDCGLKGHQIGNAKISDVHANFIVNLGGATAEDIMNLINYTKKVVLEKRGIYLHQEVESFNW